jgi:hypothetical protein
MEKHSLIPINTQKILENGRRAAEAREAARIYQMEFWPDTHMGVPNELARSALFAAIKPPKREERKLLQQAPIASQGEYLITYTGQQLDQEHIDLFEACMHFARRVQEGKSVRITRYALLKLLGKGDSKPEYDWLLLHFEHLTATAVSISQDGKRVFWGSLLPRGAIETETGEIVVEISRDLAKLFGRGLSRVEWQERREIRRHPLAKWLHLYFAGHAQPHPVSVEWLRQHSGSDTRELKRFRESLRKALQKLKDVGALDAWHIDPKADLVHVKRRPTPLQSKHLASQTA